MCIILLSSLLHNSGVAFLSCSPYGDPTAHALVCEVTLKGVFVEWFFNLFHP